MDDKSDVASSSITQDNQIDEDDAQKLLELAGEFYAAIICFFLIWFGSRLVPIVTNSSLCMKNVHLKCQHQKRGSEANSILFYCYKYYWAVLFM